MKWDGTKGGRLYCNENPTTSTVGFCKGNEMSYAGIDVFLCYAVY